MVSGLQLESIRNMLALPSSPLFFPFHEKGQGSKRGFDPSAVHVGTSSLKFEVFFCINLNHRDAKWDRGTWFCDPRLSWSIVAFSAQQFFLQPRRYFYAQCFHRLGWTWLRTANPFHWGSDSRMEGYSSLEGESQGRVGGWSLDHRRWFASA